MENNEKITIKDISEKLGISSQIIRRLCDNGLVPGVRRYGRKSQRLFDPWQVDWMQVLIGLKRAGFGQREIRRFARLFRQGDVTLPERKAMLETRKRQLWQELENIQAGIDVMERQIEVIDTQLK